MKALVFRGRQCLEIAEIDAPRCGPQDVVLRVAACGVCGGDARSFFGGDQVLIDRVPGHEPTGIVVETGSSVKNWRTGDRIALAAEVHCHQCWYCRRELFQLCDNLCILGKHVDGALAEYMLLGPAILERGVVNRVPAGLSLLRAALSEPMCSVLASHEELSIQPGDRVVVLGCGPMGILHLELLLARGAEVAIVDLLPMRLQRAATDFGATYTIDASVRDTVSAIRDWTGGIGADVAITATPSPDAVAQSVMLVRKRGRIGIFGGLLAKRAKTPLDVNRIHYSEIRVIGNFSYHPATHKKALDLLASGQIHADKLIRMYALEDTARALVDIRDGNVLKAVVVPNGRLES